MDYGLEEEKLVIKLDVFRLCHPVTFVVLNKCFLRNGAVPLLKHFLCVLLGRIEIAR